MKTPAQINELKGRLQRTGRLDGVGLATDDFIDLMEALDDLAMARTALERILEIQGLENLGSRMVAREALR